MSIFYTVFGVSVMMAKSISVGFGTGAVLLVYKFSLKLWEPKGRRKISMDDSFVSNTCFVFSYNFERSLHSIFLIVCLIGIDNYIKKKLFYL